MIPLSACRPWRADLPGPAGEHGDNAVSYTTRWDTIQSGRMFLQHVDDLLFRKSALAHVRLPKERTLPKIEDIYGEQVTLFRRGDSAINSGGNSIPWWLAHSIVF
jgi:hypothetical protein